MQELKDFFTNPWIIGIGGSGIVAFVGWLLTRSGLGQKNNQKAKAGSGSKVIQVAGDYHHTEEKKTSTPIQDQ